MHFTKTLKNGFLAFTLAIMLFNSVAFALEPVNLFSDVKTDDKYADAIKYLKDQGVVRGYSDGTYAPGKTITRAEFLKILIEVSGYKPEGENCFKDVKTQWFAPYVCKAASLGFVKGYSKDYFGPARDISLAEASKMISEVLGVEVDNAKDENWYQKYMYALGVMKAIPPEFKSFENSISRGQMAEMIWRIKEKISNQDYTTYRRIKDNTQMVASTGSENLMHFKSCADIKDYVDENSTSRNYGYEMSGAKIMMSQDSAISEATAAEGSSASDYSSTNVQVAGVDEADIVKNDGKYVYLVKGNTVRIVSAYPPTDMQEVAKITFDDAGFRPNEMYLDGDVLAVIGSGYNYEHRILDEIVDKISDSVPYSGPETKLYIFDIADRKNPVLKRKVAFEGGYISSRKIDEMVYVVANKSLYRYYPIPMLEDSVTKTPEPMVKCADVGYIPETENLNYLIVAGVSVNDFNAEILKQIVVGSSENIYASQKNLYVVSQKRQSHGWIYDKNSVQNEKTAINKFTLNSDEIGYAGEGEVPGHILNQFSMDENDDYFRIATTLGEVWSSQQKSKNNLYVLDEDLKVVGKIEDIAPGEKIYSVRFIGERAYMVTFKKVDPLFVIDVSSPTNPKIIGKLKIPGYSDYLHPYDENHIIGFGKDAIDASEDQVGQRDLDFAWYQGMKVAMFDVTDPENPVELHKIVIGDRGTDSPLLNNHKALLFNKEKGFMAFPITVTEVPQNLKDNPETPTNTYGDTVFQGAYVFDVSIADGFKLRGKISQYLENEVSDKSGSYWYGNKDIQRIIYIGEYFYTMSQKEVMATGMTDMQEKGKVEMEGDDEVYYY